MRIQTELGHQTFTGRTRELMSLCRELDSVDGPPRLIEVVGEPGIGKTRLLTEALAGVDGDRNTVVAGTADTQGCGTFAPLPAGLPGVARQEVDGGLGLVLVVDDAHLASPEMETEIIRILHHPPARRMSLVVAHRPRQCSTRLLAAIGGSQGRWRHVRLQVGPLDREESLSITAEEVCVRHRSTIHEKSGGNPRYLRALIALCGGSDCVDGSDIVPDPDALAPLSMEIEALPGPIRAVAYAASVFDGHFPPERLARVADLDIAETLTAVGALVDADVLRANAGRRGFVYRHQVLRWAAYYAAPLTTRLVAHRRAAHTLREEGRPVTDYADHLCRSEDGDDARALLIEAAKAVEVSDPVKAVRWYESVLAHMGEDDPRSRLEIMLGLARVCVSSGRIDRGRTLMAEVDSLLDHTDPRTPETGEVIELRAWLAQIDGHYTQARALLHTGIAGRGVHDAHRLRTALAATSLWDTGWDWSDGAVLSVMGSEDPVAQAVVLGIHATTRLSRGDTEVARHSAVEAAKMIERRSDGQLARRPEALTHLAWVEAHLDTCDVAIRHFTRGLSIVRRGGCPPAVVPMLVGLGLCQLRQGRVVEALARVEEAVRLAELMGAADLIAMALNARAQVWLVEGAVLAALADAQNAINAVSPDSPWWRRARISQGGAHLLAGDVSEAIHALLDGAGDHLSELPVWERPAVAESLCRAEAARGDHDEALSWAARATAAAEALGTAQSRCLADLALSAAARRPSEALAHALDAIVAGGSSLTCSFEMGRAHAAAARALLALGDAGSAGRHMERLALSAERTGAGALAALVPTLRAEIERFEGAPPLVEESRHKLSRREFEIAGLVSEGHTNRQIARRLEMSHKTVETHLGRIFGKLEVASRAEIAAMMGRGEIGVRPQRSKAGAGTVTE
ncbi:LuxR C-terminal-related transcriptional regulator [Nocardiopsis sp. NPDC055879]